MESIYDAEECYQAVKAAYKEQQQVTWLEHSDVNDSEGHAVTQAVADKYNLKTCSDAWAVASELVYSANGEFIDPITYGGLPRMM